MQFCAKALKRIIVIGLELENKNFKVKFENCNFPQNYFQIPKSSSSQIKRALVN